MAVGVGHRLRRHPDALGHVLQPQAARGLGCMPLASHFNDEVASPHDVRTSRRGPRCPVALCCAVRRRPGRDQRDDRHPGDGGRAWRPARPSSSRSRRRTRRSSVASWSWGRGWATATAPAGCCCSGWCCSPACPSSAGPRRRQSGAWWPPARCRPGGRRQHPQRVEPAPPPDPRPPAAHDGDRGVERRWRRAAGAAGFLLGGLLTDGWSLAGDLLDQRPGRARPGRPHRLAGRPGAGDRPDRAAGRRWVGPAGVGRGGAGRRGGPVRTLRHPPGRRRRRAARCRARRRLCRPPAPGHRPVGPGPGGTGAHAAGGGRAVVRQHRDHQRQARSCSPSTCRSGSAPARPKQASGCCRSAWPWSPGRPWRDPSPGG